MLFDVNPDALLVLDSAARILHANAAARTLLELGDSAPATLQPESLGLVNESWEDVVSRADAGAVVIWEANPFGAPPASTTDRTSAITRVMDIQFSRLPASPDPTHQPSTSGRHIMSPIGSSWSARDRTS